MAVFLTLATIIAAGCTGDDESIVPQGDEEAPQVATTDGTSSSQIDTTAAGVGTGSTNEDSDTPTVTQIVDEFVVSTTANPTDEMEIDKNGKEIVEAWWYPTEATTYAELAETLLSESLITEAFADQWKSQGDQPLVPAPEGTEIIKMWPVRVAPDNATFQISAVAEGEIEETWTFIEFELENGSWKATGIE